MLRVIIFPQVSPIHSPTHILHVAQYNQSILQQQIRVMGLATFLSSACDSSQLLLIHSLQCVIKERECSGELKMKWKIQWAQA